MSQVRNKVEWCLRKAGRELKDSDKHRGLVKIKVDTARAKEHIGKAEHYLKATAYLKMGKFSDISASTIFYSMYHCLLAIAVKFGYESRNQECTFALIFHLIEVGEIKFEKDVLNRIASLDVKEAHEKVVDIREHYQYGTELSMEDDLYEELIELAKQTMAEAKEIIER